MQDGDATQLRLSGTHVPAPRTPSVRDDEAVVVSWGGLRETVTSSGLDDVRIPGRVAVVMKLVLVLDGVIVVVLERGT